MPVSLEGIQLLTCKTSDACFPPLWLSVTIESRLTNTSPLGLEICGWIQNYFFLKKEHRASHTTPVQNAVIISWLFKAKPPNHTFWNSHSVSTITDTLSGERRTEVAFCTVPQVLWPLLRRVIFSLWEYCYQIEPLQAERQSQTHYRMLVALPSDVGKLESSPCVESRGTKIWELDSCPSPRWVCWPLGDCLHWDLSYPNGLVGWRVTKKYIFRKLPGQMSKTRQMDTCLRLQGAQNIKSLTDYTYCWKYTGFLWGRDGELGWSKTEDLQILMLQNLICTCPIP